MALFIENAREAAGRSFRLGLVLGSLRLEIQLNTFFGNDTAVLVFAVVDGSK